MLAADLAKGHDYAQRAKPVDAACPLLKVTFIGPARAGKAKIRHADGDLGGLEEWVPTRTLMAPWGQRQAFLRDESKWNTLQEAAARDYDSVVEEAISAERAQLSHHHLRTCRSRRRTGPGRRGKKTAPARSPDGPEGGQQHSHRPHHPPAQRAVT